MWRKHSSCRGCALSIAAYPLPLEAASGEMQTHRGLHGSGSQGKTVFCQDTPRPELLESQVGEELGTICEGSK